jgi:hypothetical protein
MFVFSFRVGGTFRILMDRRPSPIAIVAGREKKKNENGVGGGVSRSSGNLQS